MANQIDPRTGEPRRGDGTRGAYGSSWGIILVLIIAVLLAWYFWGSTRAPVDTGTSNTTTSEPATTPSPSDTTTSPPVTTPSPSETTPMQPAEPTPTPTPSPSPNPNPETNTNTNP